MIFVTEELPPFNFQNAKGEILGPAKKIAERICVRLKVDCKFLLQPTRRMVRMSESGEANGLFTMAKNEKRLATMYYSKPYVRTAYGFFVMDKDPIKITAPNDLMGYTVVTLAPSNMYNTLNRIFTKEYPGTAKIATELSLKTVFRMLSRDRFGDKSAAYSNRETGRDIIKKEKLKGLRYAGTQRSLLYYFAFPKKAPQEAFVNDFNRELVAMHGNGDLAAILAEYGMEMPSVEDMK